MRKSDSVFCQMPSGSLYTKRAVSKRNGERERETSHLIHLASLCCCSGPVVTSEIEDEHERELQRNPFTSKKSAPNYSESKYRPK